MAKLIACQVKYARELYASKEHTVADIVALLGVPWGAWSNASAAERT